MPCARLAESMMRCFSTVVTKILSEVKVMPPRKVWFVIKKDSQHF